MPTLREDLQNGHRMESSYVGAAIVRVFHSEGLTAPGAEIIREALYQSPGLPQLGDLYPSTHPGLPASNLRVTNYTLTPTSPDSVLIEVLYQPPNTASGGSWNQPPPAGDGQDVKRVSSSVRESVTTRDASGSPMVLSPPTKKTLGQPYLSEARTFVPVGTVVFERPEDAPPVARLRAFVGKVNSVAVGPYAAGTLLFAAYDAPQEDGGNTWRVTYEFDYDPAGWLHKDSWKDESGRAPDDAAEVTWQVIPSADFTALDLDFSDNQTPI